MSYQSCDCHLQDIRVLRPLSAFLAGMSGHKAGRRATRWSAACLAACFYMGPLLFMCDHQKRLSAVPFQECLGVKLEKGDEMECLVGGCNFLLTSVPREAYTFRSGAHAYIDKGGRGFRDVLLVSMFTGCLAAARLRPQQRKPVHLPPQLRQAMVGRQLHFTYATVRSSSLPRRSRLQEKQKLQTCSGRPAVMARVCRRCLLFRHWFLFACAANGDAYPYLLVNIGSGVSMLKVRALEDCICLLTSTGADRC